MASNNSDQISKALSDELVRRAKKLKAWKIDLECKEKDLSERERRLASKEENLIRRESRMFKKVGLPHG